MMLRMQLGYVVFLGKEGVKLTFFFFFKDKETVGIKD